VRVCAVLVNWNGGEDNLHCIDSLLEQGPLIERIVFVDNASSDGSLSKVRERYGELVTIANDANLGFGGGSNQGLSWALERGFDAVLIVNNDVVLPAGQLEILIAALEADARVGLVGPRVLDRTDPARIWAAGGLLTWRQNLTTLRGHGQLDGERWRSTTPVDYVVGCCMLARREVLEQAGLFDAAYFAYTEDVDLCLRAGRAGFASRCIGAAHCLHTASSATGGGYNPRRKYMMGVNSIWFLRRWAGPAQWCQFFLFDVLTLPFAWLLGVFRGRGKAVLAKAAGILDGLRGRRITASTVQQGSSWLW
jgi:hypothetical protein